MSNGLYTILSKLHAYLTIIPIYNFNNSNLHYKIALMLHNNLIIMQIALITGVHNYASCCIK